MTHLARKGTAPAPERMFRMGWALAPLGVWLIISPWVATAAHTARAGIIWNNVWLGAVVALLGPAAMGLTAGVSRRPRATDPRRPGAEPLTRGVPAPNH
ncbi:SPW repeat protein [Streptomyces mexicanus]|uniref:SPW repeat protein n=1 Tax=Streptomyces mexicanus TaxID=178566 RepID=UPI0031EDE4BB